MFFLVADEFWRVNDAFHSLMGTGNVVLQFIVLGMIMMSVHSKRKGDLVTHGNLMIIAVITNFFSFALVMLTGFIYFYVSEPLSWSYRFSVFHGIVGGAAILMSLMLTVPWVIRGGNMKFCAGKRNPCA